LADPSSLKWWHSYQVVCFSTCRVNVYWFLLIIPFVEHLVLGFTLIDGQKLLRYDSIAPIYYVLRGIDRQLPLQVLAVEDPSTPIDYVLGYPLSTNYAIIGIDIDLIH
jgi:hypothetical protein